MQNHRFSILGSCVSFDIFRVTKTWETCVFAQSRTSLISLMSPRLAVPEVDLMEPSNFCAKMVKADFAKTFFDDLEAAGPKYLIVDFVDERFDLLRAGDSYVTNSPDLEKCTKGSLTKYGFERLERMAPETRDLWRDACSRFAKTLRRRFPDLPVILHKSWGTARYRSGDQILELPPDMLGIQLEAFNGLLEQYCSWFSEDLGSVIELELPHGYRADREHSWGPHPFHYEERYYLDAGEILPKLTVGTRRTSALARARALGTLARLGRVGQVG